MSYQRVIPRDLFNEANLLKCYGQLYLKLEPYFSPRTLLQHDDGFPFEVHQSQDDGGLTITNIRLIVNETEYGLYRPLNSREPWPLYFIDYENLEHVPVFSDDGELSDAMLAMLTP